MNRHDDDQLTMTALRDLDPAPAIFTLDEDERARADATFARIVSAPDQGLLPVEPEVPSRARLPRRLLVAVGLAAAAGVGTSAVLLGGTAYGSWTPTPRPLAGAAAAAAASSCRTALEVPDGGERLLIAEQRGQWTYVLIGGPRTQAACLLPNGLVGAEAGDYEGHFFGTYDADVPPAPQVAPDGLAETTTMSGATDEGLVNWSEGYVGRDVVGVTVHTPTGRRVEASVARGRFAAWWPAGEAKADNPEIAEASTITVTLADGSTRHITGDS